MSSVENLAHGFVKEVVKRLTPKMQFVFNILNIFFIFIYISEGTVLASQNNIENGTEQKIKTSFQIANDYIHHVRKWEEGTFVLRMKGRENDYIYVFSAYKLEDKQRMQELIKNLPEGKLSGFYPSEFIMVIDAQKGKVIKDIRHAEQEQQPRP